LKRGATLKVGTARSTLRQAGIGEDRAPRSPWKPSPIVPNLEREAGFEPATLSLGRGSLSA